MNEVVPETVNCCNRNTGLHYITEILLHNKFFPLTLYDNKSILIAWISFLYQACYQEKLHTDIVFKTKKLSWAGYFTTTNWV